MSTIESLPEPWKHVWRIGLAPQLSLAQLDILAVALETDDPGLIQGCTTSPPCLDCTGTWKCQGACLIGYVAWKTWQETLNEIQDYFARVCRSIDERVGEDAGCRWLLNYFDETPREKMRQELLVEVRAEQKRRQVLVSGVGDTGAVA